LKKVLAFLAFLLTVFIVLAYIVNLQDDKPNGISNENQQADTTGQVEAPPNPYQKETLHPETIKQLDDPHYQNIILPETLAKWLEEEEDVTVYFYSPTCPHCREVTPVLMEVAEELNKKIYQFNLLEFEDGWDDYHLERIPALVQYKKGKETARLIGSQSKDTYKEWLLNNS